MKLNLIALIIFSSVAFQAQAQTVTLNPGDTNNLGVVLTCTPAGSTPVAVDPTPVAVDPTPAPAPQPVQVLVPTGDKVRQIPNMACVNAANAADNDHLGKQIDSCGQTYIGRRDCDQLINSVNNVDQDCYRIGAAKAHGPLGSHQENAIKKGCTITISDCAMNQWVQP